MRYPCRDCATAASLAQTAAKPDSSTGANGHTAIALGTKGAAPGTRLTPIAPRLRPRPLGSKASPSLSASLHQPRPHAVRLRDLGRLTSLPHCAQHTKPEAATQPLRLGRLKHSQSVAVSRSACALGVSHCTGSAAYANRAALAAAPLGSKASPNLSASHHQPRSYAVRLRDLRHLTSLPHCAQPTKPEASTQPLRLGRLKPARTGAISHSVCALGKSTLCQKRGLRRSRRACGRAPWAENSHQA